PLPRRALRCSPLIPREMTMAVPPMPGLWNWPNPQPAFEFPGWGPEGPDYAGYKVVANDGEIGHVDSFAVAPDESHIVVDTGGGVFGRVSLIAAAAVRLVDTTSPRPFRSISRSNRSRTRRNTTGLPGTAPSATVPRSTTGR